MKNLQVSDTLSLPIDTVTDTLGVLAIKGAGKTYTFLVLVEEMVKRGFPVVVLDPVGVCWGLRLDADGKAKGLDVLILGGRNGDVPLESTAGKVIADFVIAERRPIVLDMSSFDTKAEQMRFVLDFTTRLYHANRDPIHVVMDEADGYLLIERRASRRFGVEVPATRIETRYAVVTPGKSIRIVGLAYPKGNYGDSRYNAPAGDNHGAYDRTFAVGESVEYDSFNLAYHGKITSIGAGGNVSVAKELSTRSARLDAETFTSRNWDLDLGAAFERNSEMMMTL